MPTGLTATPSVSSSGTSHRIDLAWQPVQHPDVEGYNIYRSVSGGPFVRHANLAASSTTFRDSSLIPGTLYAYYITARNFLSVESGATEVAETTTLGETPTIPTAPSNLLATRASRTQINLAWTDNSANETSFVIERSLDGNAWSELVTTGANVTTHPDTGLSRNTRYYYRVRAFNTAGYSDYSNVSSATTSAEAGGAVGAGGAGVAGGAGGAGTASPGAGLAPRESSVFAGFLIHEDELAWLSPA